MLFKTFIIYRDKYRNSSNSTNYKTSRLKCSKSSIESVEIKSNKKGHNIV
jgi:hypothetical protein